MYFIPALEEIASLENERFNLFKIKMHGQEKAKVKVKISHKVAMTPHT